MIRLKTTILISVATFGFLACEGGGSGGNSEGTQYPVVGGDCSIQDGKKNCYIVVRKEKWMGGDVRVYVSNQEYSNCKEGTEFPRCKG